MTWDDSADPTSINAPFGVWEASNWWTPDAYRLDGDLSFDYALVEFAPRGGRYLGDLTGSWGITYGLRWVQDATLYLMGYPASGIWSTAQGYHGRGQYACSTEYDSYKPIGSGYELWAPCTMNGGASGGPWFVKLSDGSWTLGGVNSQCHGPNMNDRVYYCTPTSDFLRSPYLDTRFADFWNSVIPQLSY
jgi:hypothetical protein